MKLQNAILSAKVSLKHPAMGGHDYKKLLLQILDADDSASTPVDVQETEAEKAADELHAGRSYSEDEKPTIHSLARSIDVLSVEAFELGNDPEGVRLSSIADALRFNRSPQPTDRSEQKTISEVCKDNQGLPDGGRLQSIEQKEEQE